MSKEKQVTALAFLAATFALKLAAESGGSFAYFTIGAVIGFAAVVLHEYGNRRPPNANRHRQNT